MMFDESTDDETEVRVRVELLDRDGPSGGTGNDDDQYQPVTFEDLAAIRLGRPRFVFCRRRSNKFCRKIRMMESKPLLTCRSNEHGIEVVLSYVWVDFTEDPTYMAWRTFKVQERKYTLYDRAAAAIFFGILKFKTRLTGNFTIVTDFKPLVALYNREGLGTRRHTLPSILKFVADQLITYNYKIMHRTNAQIKESLR